MIISEEFTGKKVQDAIDDGLRKFRKTIDDVDVKVLSQGGFLKKAKVVISFEAPDPKPEKTIVSEKEEKTVVKENKPFVREEKAVVKENKPFVREEKSVAKENKPFIREEKPVIKENKPFVREEKSVAKENKPFVREEKAVVKENKQFVREERHTPKDDGAFMDKKKRPSGEKREDSIPPSPEQKDKVVSFLTELTQRMGIEATIKAEVGNDLNVIIDTADSAVIGHRGETLDALQYLSSIAINDERGKHVHVAVDALSYRQKRHDSLVALAQRMAEKVDKTGKRMSLEPMSSGDRRIIHAALSEDDRVVTRSEGFEPNRKILIYPKRKPTPKEEEKDTEKTN